MQSAPNPAHNTISVVHSADKDMGNAVTLDTREDVSRFIYTAMQHVRIDNSVADFFKRGR